LFIFARSESAAKVVILDNGHPTSDNKALRRGRLVFQKGKFLGKQNVDFQKFNAEKPSRNTDFLI